VTLAVVVVWLIVGAGGASVVRAEPEGNHCILPSGVDLNEFYGVSAQIVNIICGGEAGAGEQWTVSIPWLMNDTFKHVPKGFVPAGDTPLEDLLAKFVGVTYVVDPGTAQEQTHAFPNDGGLWTGILEGLPAVNTITLGTLAPLAVGAHVVEAYWVFSALHCDGLAAVLDENCLPAGETLFRRIVVQVTPGHH
jgi:hypothetical protein